MKFEKNDSWIFCLISDESDIFDIMLAAYNLKNQVIDYEDLDQGINRLITNKYIRKEKNKFKRTQKGNLLYEQYCLIAAIPEAIASLNDKFDFFFNIEMEKAPNLLRYFVRKKEYNTALYKLATELGEDKLIIINEEDKKSDLPIPSKSRNLIFTMLKDANMDVDNLNLDKLCQILREFMNSKFKSEADDLLFQTGVFSNPDIFEVDFTRQFSISNKFGEYGHLTQLHITLEYENTIELSKWAQTLWSMDYNSLDDFFTAVRIDESYIIAKQDGKLKNITIEYERV